MKIIIIAACARNRVIGQGNMIPWMGEFPEDMRHFKSTTSGEGKAVLMGRKTWESIGSKPLKNRVNIVMTRSFTYPLDPYAVRVQSAAEAIQWARRTGIKELYVIGGEEVYKEALRYADEIILTVIEQAFAGDKQFPIIDQEQYPCWAYEVHQGSFDYQIQHYKRKA